MPWCSSARPPTLRAPGARAPNPSSRRRSQPWKGIHQSCNLDVTYVCSNRASVVPTAAWHDSGYMTTGVLMPPAATDGLYDNRFEHDACGVGIVADLSAKGGHDVVASALRVLCNLEHRGAAGADPDTGDGAGILTQIPDVFFRAVTGFALPQAGAYAAGLAFLPADSSERTRLFARIAELAADEGLTVLGWRDVPIDPAACGPGARAVLRHLAQLFVAGAGGERGMELERMAFCLRKRAEHETGVYFASLSARTIVYKGMLSAPQLGPFYPDLSDPAYTSTLALVHSRFSTNTFPSWPLAHPYRYVAHNGEINTVRGN